MAQSAPTPTTDQPANPSRPVPDDAVIEETPAGGLVYEPLTEYRATIDADVRIGRRLLGFIDIESWQAVRDELRKRSHGTGATRHLPEFSHE